MMSNDAGGEYLAEQAGQFAPLGIGAAAANGQGMTFESFQRFYFDAQFGHRARGGRLIEDFFFGGFDFVVGGFIKVIDVFAIEGRQRCGEDRRGLPPALKDFEFA